MYNPVPQMEKKNVLPVPCPTHVGFWVRYGVIRIKLTVDCINYLTCFHIL